MNNKSLPASISILFENKYLDSMNILFILYVLKDKEITIDILTYYYTILNSSSIVNSEFNINYSYIQNTYLDINKNIKRLLIILKNQDLIEIRSYKNDKNTTLQITCSEKGINTIEGLESKYYTSVLDKCEIIKTKYPFNSKNKKLVWRNSWDIR